MKNSISGSVSNVSVDAAEEAPLEKTDMAKVNYFLSRPGLLLEQLPKSRREELAEHVGRRRMTATVRKKAV